MSSNTVSQDSYELHYWPFFGRCDVIRMILELTGANFKNVIITPQTWGAHKKEQRFGHIPKFVIKSPDGKIKELWEAPLIETYLADIFDLFPSQETRTDPFLRADFLSYHSSLTEVTDKMTFQNRVVAKVEDRRTLHDENQKEAFPNHLANHEKLVKGPYYFGDKLTLVDLKLASLYLALKEIYGFEKNPINPTTTPKLFNVCKLILRENTRIVDYKENRRDFGAMAWNPETLTYAPKARPAA